jgi:hypothetical protein
MVEGVQSYCFGTIQTKDLFQEITEKLQLPLLLPYSDVPSQFPLQHPH